MAITLNFSTGEIGWSSSTLGSVAVTGYWNDGTALWNDGTVLWNQT